MCRITDPCAPYLVVTFRSEGKAQKARYRGAVASGALMANAVLDSAEITLCRQKCIDLWKGGSGAGVRYAENDEAMASEPGD